MERTRHTKLQSPLERALKALNFEYLGSVILDLKDPYIGLEVGSLVFLRYKDHALIRNIEPSRAQLIIRETIGRFEKQDHDSLYLSVDEYDEPGEKGAAAVRKTSGFLVLKSTVIEVRRIPG